MTVSAQRPLLFLDVDGTVLPIGAPPRPRPGGSPAFPVGPTPEDIAAYPDLSRIDPAHGRRLAALPCDLVWATAWMSDANDVIAPSLGLPDLPWVEWPEPSEEDEQDERDGLHWKTRAMVRWAAGRDFAWVDDEITRADHVWVAAHHPARALLRRVDAEQGLTEADFVALDTWFRDTGTSPAV